MKSCGNGGTSQQGEAFLGSRTLSVSLAESDFKLSFNSLPVGGGYDAVTATATTTDGSTSEFSPCFTIGSHPDPFVKLGVAPASATLAVSTAATPALAGDGAAVAATREKGHAKLLLSCPVSAVKYCQGTFGVTAGRRVIARGRFKILPGYVHQVRITIGGKLMSELERKHHLRATLSATVRDGAKRGERKTRVSHLKLTYVRP